MPEIQLSPATLAEIQKDIQELKAIYQNLKSLVPSLAAAMPITFDLPSFLGTLADGTVVTTRYPGVTFKSYAGGDTYARKPHFGTAHSGQNVISTGSNTAQDCAFGEPDGIHAVFGTPQKQVSVWAFPIILPSGGLGATMKDLPYLKAYDANNNLVGQVFYPASVLNAPNPGWQQLSYVSGSANITSVKFSSTVNQGGNPVVAYFDDFAFFAT